MHTVPFERLAKRFGEPVTIHYPSEDKIVTGIVSRKQEIYDKGGKTVLMTLDLPRDIDLPNNTQVTINEDRRTVVNRITDNDPGWYRYNISATKKSKPNG